MVTKQWEETGQGPGLSLSFPFISNGISFLGVFIPPADRITKAVFPASRCCGNLLQQLTMPWVHL